MRLSNTQKSVYGSKLRCGEESYLFTALRVGLCLFQWREDVSGL